MSCCHRTFLPSSATCCSSVVSSLPFLLAIVFHSLQVALFQEREKNRLFPLELTHITQAGCFSLSVLSRTHPQQRTEKESVWKRACALHEHVRASSSCSTSTRNKSARCSSVLPLALQDERGPRREIDHERVRPVVPGLGGGKELTAHVQALVSAEHIVVGRQH
jgi:hypothetical protein